MSEPQNDFERALAGLPYGVAATWLSIASACPDAPVPLVEHTLCGAIRFAWSYISKDLKVYLDIECYPDGRTEWFYDPPHQDGEWVPCEGDDEPTQGISPRFIEVLRTIKEPRPG